MIIFLQDNYDSTESPKISNIFSENIDLGIGLDARSA